MKHREEVEKLIAQCERDREEILNSARTSFDEQLVTMLEYRITELRVRLDHIDAAERVRRTIHEA